MTIIDFQTVPWDGFSTLTALQHYHITFTAALGKAENFQIVKLKNDRAHKENYILSYGKQ